MRSKPPGAKAELVGYTYVPGPLSSPAGSAKPPMRVPNETTVAWRMAVPPSSPTATTVIWLPPRGSGTVASNAPPRDVTAVTTSPPTPTYTVSASVVPAHGGRARVGHGAVLRAR